MKALVTGAASGIGRALADRLLAEGEEVVAVDRDPVAAGGGMTVLAADLADGRAVDRLTEAVVGEGPYDLAIHCAGTSTTGRFEAIPAPVHERVLTVNCETPMVMTAAMLAADAFTAPASLVFVASLSHATGYPGASVYAASKDAIAVYARSIRPALERRRIGVLTVFPGPVRTPHAARHAPAGAGSSRRMDPGVLAERIVRAARTGRRTLYPGIPAKIGRVAGLLMPGTTTRLMRRAFLDRFDRPAF